MRVRGRPRRTGPDARRGGGASPTGSRRAWRNLAGPCGVAPALAALALAAPAPSAGQLMGPARHLFVSFDELEQAPGLGGSPFLFDGEAWYGGDYNRLWVEVDADAATERSEGAVEAQALFGRLVRPFWDARAGIRIDRAWGEEDRSRAHFALGLQGLAPYWFEVETTLFVDQDGNVSADLEAGYDVLLTQRAVLEPEVDLSLAVQDVPAWHTGSGVRAFGLGARLRYEIRPELAPYVGVLWERAFGDTADLLRRAGEPRGDATLVAGIRVWR